MGKEDKKAATSSEVAATEQAATEQAATEQAATEQAATEQAATEQADKKEVKFLLSPTGKYNLGYNVGETATLPALQAEELVESAYAEYVK